MREYSVGPQVARGEAAFCHRLPEGAVGCDLCPRFCELAPGERGWCGTRYNKDARLWAANHNWLALLQFAKVESVPLVEYASGGAVLKLGSFGCNFQPPGGGREQFGAEIGSGRSIYPRDIVNICLNMVPQGLVGVAFAYAEPLLWYEFVMQTAMLLQKCDMRSILATAGFINPRPLTELLPYIGAVRFDLFSFDPLFYREEMRIQFDAVLRSLKLLADSPVHLEVATPLIFGKNDDPIMLSGLSAYLAEAFSPDLPYHLIAPRRKLSPAERERIMQCADACGRNLRRVCLS